MSRQHPETATEAVTYAIGEFEWRQDHSQYTSAEEFIGFLRERGYDVTPLQEEEDDNVRGCSCGMADYGAPGHDGDPEDSDD